MSRLLPGLVAVWILATAGVSASVVGFERLAPFDPADRFTSAHGVSADGRVVVGEGGSASQRQALRWVADQPPGASGFPRAGDILVSAGGTSADGSVTVGFAQPADPRDGNAAFRWLSSGLQTLPPLPGDVNRLAHGVSGNGQLAVGSSGDGTDLQPVAWLISGPASPLPTLPGGDGTGEARGVSGSGSVTVGWSDDGNGERAVRWIGGAVSPLSRLSTDETDSVAQATAADGLTAVGYSDSPAGREAVRWDAAGLATGLGRPATPGGYSWARDASADGTVVVGFFGDRSGDDAFIWDATHGLRDLQQVLVDAGLTDALAGVDLLGANAVSDDGRVIVGNAELQDGTVIAWRATIPEPGTAMVLLATGLLVGRSRICPSRCTTT